MDSKNIKKSNSDMNSAFHLIEGSEKKVIFEDISSKTGMPPYAVEKDWWVTQSLRALFELEVGNHLVFKGGTSLSKGWNLVERFSEDIDLVIDRSFLGFEGDLSKSQRTKLRKATHTYVTEKLYPELEIKFQEMGLNGVIFRTEETTESDKDPTIIEIYYPAIIESPGYIENRVQIEMGCRSLREPFTKRSINSLVDEFHPSTPFAMSSFDIPVVNPERTFLEKIFLLHEEFHRPKEKIRIDRLSRHLYDVFQLSKSEYTELVLDDKELYETIVKHRYSFARVSGVDYNSHQPKIVDPFPKDEFIEGWKNDYRIMQEQMIFGESPSFEEMIKSIGNFIDQLRKVEWKIDHQFPPPANPVKK